MENNQVTNEKEYENLVENETKVDEFYVIEEEQVDDQSKKTVKVGSKFKWMNKIFMSAVCGLVFGAAFFLVNNMAPKYYIEEVEVEEITQETEIHTATATVTSGGLIETNVTTITNNVMPSIVSITSLSVQEVMSFFGSVNTYESESAGSGIIIGKNDNELLILTNNHVVEGSTTLTVTFVDEESVEAVVKGSNAGKDIAVISISLDSISEETMDSLKIATVGDSKLLQAGEPVIAIGNALGYGQSVTTGVVSATGRTIDGIEGELIQTDAAINPGNSGGALLNSYGEVIGINTAKVSQSAVEGMGYAIPITDATETIEVLMNRETKTVVDEVDRGYLGIQGVSVSEETSTLYNMPEGVYIAEVLEGSACEDAGVYKGSIITGIDGSTISNMEDLQKEMTYCAAGDEITLELQVPENNGEYSKLTIELVLRKG